VGSPVVARINSLLKEKGISKSQFYRDCGITSAAYSQWNTGKTDPKIKTLERIADYLGTTTAFLLGEKEKPATGDGDGQEYVNDDPELTALLERARDDPHLRMLFSVTKNATAKDIEQAIKIIQALKGE